MAWTTTDFLSDVKLKGFLPDTSNVTDSEILRVGDGEVRTKIAPLVVGSEQEFWIAEPLETSWTAGLTHIRIPSQALLGRVRDVTLIDSEGNESDPINKVPIERFASYSRGAGSWWQTMFYTVRGDKILLPDVTPPSGWSIRVYYYRRPNAMTEVSNCMVITAVSGAPQVLSGSPVGGWGIGTKLDVIQAQPNFDLLRSNSAATSVTGGVSFADETDDVLVGDYVAPTGLTPVVPVPDLCYELLVSATTYQILKMTGFYEQAAFERSELTQTMASVVGILAPRVKSPSEKVINRYGPLRKGRF